MNLLGWEITKSKSTARPIVSNSGGFFAPIREAFTGAWQRNIEYTDESVIANPTLFRCITQISSDIGKLPLHLYSVDEDDVWTKTQSVAFSPVLRRPNAFQTRQQFTEGWIHSKLTTGNAYVLKRRDARNVVIALTVLDPKRVTPLITEDGEVFYDIRHDDLAKVDQHGLVVPASEIIHDRFNCLHHPLVGLSPILAAGLAAHSGLEAAKNSARFFANGSRPGGVLTAPGAISEETAKELKATWDTAFSGANSGKTAVLGDGLTYQAITTAAVDAQLIEQMRWNAEVICSVFGIPSYMVGVGDAPTYNNIAALNQQYYSQCLQPLISAMEDLLDEGLNLVPYRCSFDLDELIRLDEASLVTTLREGVSAGIIAPNEARRRLNLKPVKGGSDPLIQRQNFSLAALAERDANQPFASDPHSLPPTNNNETEEAETQARKALDIITKGLA